MRPISAICTHNGKIIALHITLDRMGNVGQAVTYLGLVYSPGQGLLCNLEQTQDFRFNFTYRYCNCRVPYITINYHTGINTNNISIF